MIDLFGQDEPDLTGWVVSGAVAQTLDFLSTGQCLTLVIWGAALGVVGSWMGMQRFASWR